MPSGVVRGAARTGGRAGGDLARGHVEDGAAPVGLLFGLLERLEDGGCCWWWWGRHREEGSFVGFGVADEGCDVVVGEEGVGEDFRLGEAVSEEEYG